MKRSYWVVVVFPLLLIGLQSCRKDVIIVEDNDPPYYDEIPTVMVENYVNKIYIDLIGREPLNVEMDADVQLLKDNDLDEETRNSICLRLQTDTTWRAGDSSYSYAYFHRIYELQKARMLESISNAELERQRGIARNAAYVDSLSGNMIEYEKNMQTVALYDGILKSEERYFSGEIELKEMYAAMLNNPIYDQINMNTFNFVNATFNDLFFRFPTAAEYDQAYNMIEFNATGILFQHAGQNKIEYIDILIHTREYYEGLIRWAFFTLIARDATTVEVSELMQEFWFDHDLKSVQRKIMVTDEYANFK